MVISCYLYIHTLLFLHIFCYVCFVAAVVFFFLQAVQGIFRMEEIYHSVAQQLDDERQRRVSAVQMLNIAENSNKDLKEKLKTEEQLKKSAEAALKGAETQAESQRKLVIEVKGQLVTAKEQIATNCKLSAVKGGSNKGKKSVIDLSSFSPKSKKTRSLARVYDDTRFRSYATYQAYLNHFKGPPMLIERVAEQDRKSVV